MALLLKAAGPFAAAVGDVVLRLPGAESLRDTTDVGLCGCTDTAAGTATGEATLGAPSAGSPAARSATDFTARRSPSTSAAGTGTAAAGGKGDDGDTGGNAAGCAGAADAGG